MQWFGGYLGLAIMGRMVLPIQRRTRIDSLDVVRGIAVCGIAFVNIAPIVRFDSWAENAVSHFLNLFVQQRFFPIFSLLFGVGFGMMWSRARERSQRPRLVLLRRILFLLALGIPHAMVNSGEALLPYATVALVILLPATWIPQRWLVPVTAGLGALSLVGLLAIGGGSIMIVPSLLLLGFAYAVSGEVEHCEDDFRVFVFACAVLLPAVIGCLYWQLHPSSPEMALQAESVAGTVLAAFYIAVIMLLMHTPARRIDGRVCSVGTHGLDELCVRHPGVLHGEVVGERRAWFDGWHSARLANIDASGGGYADCAVHRVSIVTAALQARAARTIMALGDVGAVGCHVADCGENFGGVRSKGVTLRMKICLSPSSKNAEFRAWR